MKTRYFLPLLVSGLFHTTLGQMTQRMTVEDAVRIGLEKSKAIHASMMKVQYADAHSSEMDALRWPTLKFAGSYARLSTIPDAEVVTQFGTIRLFPAVLNNYNFRLTLQQPLFTGFRLERNADIAGLNAQATQKEFEKDRSELIWNIKSAYWNLAKAIELKKVVDDNVGQIKAHVRDAENLQKQGLVTSNDVLKIKVQLSEAILRQIDMKNNVELGRISLNSTLGLPLETQFELESVMQREPKKFGELNALLQQALEKRPEIQSTGLRVKASDAAVSLAQSNWWPQVYLVGNYLTARPNQRFFPIEDSFKDTWDVGVSVSFDIWNWGSTVHQTDQATAQLMQTQDAFAQLRDAVALDVTRNYLNLGRARERIGVAEDGVRQAEENYKVTSAKFKQGLGTNSDLLDAEVALLQARTNYTQALVDFSLAEASLEEAIGE
ncbi:MAG: TolC family protein [Ignavibacteriales bacterium]|nr:TolC family protein [Ignavibacteriales bacterium]